MKGRSIVALAVLIQVAAVAAKVAVLYGFHRGP